MHLRGREREKEEEEKEQKEGDEETDLAPTVHHVGQVVRRARREHVVSDCHRLWRQQLEFHCQQQIRQIQLLDVIEEEKVHLFSV
jgi:hypothetical protein